MIAIASGKGGVGKSTIALNLALALHQMGNQVGLLDADIYGPSQPTMLGVEDVRPKLGNRGFMPVVKYDLQTMSIGYMIDPNAPLAWRGPMLGKALEQLLFESDWPQLDYLVIDLPPGTGDVQLTLCQKIAITGAILITTPQEVALRDVTRACEMFKKLNVPILGVIENMAAYQCTQCGHQEPIFGTEGGTRLAEKYQLDLLASLPLARGIQVSTDEGKPLMVFDKNGAIAQLFSSIAEKITQLLSADKLNEELKGATK